MSKRRNTKALDNENRISSAVTQYNTYRGEQCVFLFKKKELLMKSKMGISNSSTFHAYSKHLNKSDFVNFAGFIVFWECRSLITHKLIHFGIFQTSKVSSETPEWKRRWLAAEVVSTKRTLIHPIDAEREKSSPRSRIVRFKKSFMNSVYQKWGIRLL